MGEVWLGTDEVLGRQVAVKLLKAELADDGTFRTRFETEARNAAACSTPASPASSTTARPRRGTARACRAPTW